MNERISEYTDTIPNQKTRYFIEINFLIETFELRLLLNQGNVYFRLWKRETNRFCWFNKDTKSAQHSKEISYSCLHKGSMRTRIVYFIADKPSCTLIMDNVCSVNTHVHMYINLFDVRSVRYWIKPIIKDACYIVYYITEI